MKVVRIALVAVLVCTSVASALAADDQAAARARYGELAAKVRAGDPGVDWQALRVAAVMGVVEDPQDFQVVRDGYAALNESKFEDALKDARKVEDHNLADADSHYVAWRPLVELGRSDEAEKERLILAALMDSIMKSGDGKSAETAWFAATIREEYLVMQMMLNVQFKSQHSQRIGEHYFDVVAVKDESGKEQILWFNTDTDFRRMDAVTERLKQKP